MIKTKYRLNDLNKILLPKFFYYLISVVDIRYFQNMKICQLFLRSLTRLNFTNVFNNKNHIKIAATTLGLGFATWLSIPKVFPDEMQII